MRANRRYWVFLWSLLALTARHTAFAATPAAPPPIRIGILHSLSGTMAISEHSLVDALFLAITQINAAGGLLGRKIEPLVEDGASDPAIFARKAELLITRDRVASIFGCWTSACRKAVVPIVEKYHHLLWYPLQYEGGEQSPNVIYSGMVPNQQLLPALEWAMSRFGKRVFLVGSDYIFPRTVNRTLREEITSRGGACIGEFYQSLGKQDFDAAIAQIHRLNPDFVMSTVNGDSNVGFYRELNSAGITPDQTPVIAFSIAEDEISVIGPAIVADHYCAWSYFQSLATPANQEFVRAFKQRYGEDRVTDDPIESAYTELLLFAAAVRKAGSTDVEAIRTATKGLEVNGPGGLIRIDLVNHHAWKTLRVGEIERNGQIREVWKSPGPIAPLVYKIK